MTPFPNPEMTPPVTTMNLRNLNLLLYYKPCYSIREHAISRKNVSLFVRCGGLCYNASLV